MGPVGGRGFGGSVKLADGKTSSANVSHLNVWGFVWGFDISAAEFPLLQASLLQLNKSNSNAGNFPFKFHYQYTCNDYNKA